MTNELDSLYEKLTLVFEIDKAGTKSWRNTEGKLHRVSGPAIEMTTGTKYWYQNGLPHRIGGPAVDWQNGVKEWWVNGERHRENGPAVEYSSGRKEWWVNGQFIKTDA